MDEVARLADRLTATQLRLAALDLGGWSLAEQAERAGLTSAMAAKDHKRRALVSVPEYAGWWDLCLALRAEGLQPDWRPPQSGNNLSHGRGVSR
jgi:hypothetical protein